MLKEASNFFRINKLINQVFLIGVINILLLLTLIFIPDFQFIMFFGGWLMFFSTIILAGKFTIKKLIAFFIFSSAPFLVIGLVYISFKIYSQICFEGILKGYPAFGLIFLALIAGFVAGIILEKSFGNSFTKRTIMISLSAFIFAVLCGYVSWPFQLAFTGYLYFIAGYINNAKSNRDYIFYYLMIIIPYNVAISPYLILNKYSHVYPVILATLVGPLIGMFSKHLYIKSKKTLFFILIILYYGIVTISYWGMKNYLEYIFGLDDTSTIKELKLDLYDVSGTSFTEKDIIGKTSVIYFHTKACKICYDKMPELEQLYQQFKNDTNILILGVFLPYDHYGDSTYIFRYHNKKGFRFPQYQSKECSKIYESRFNINAFPHVTIIGKNNNVIHNGRFNNNSSIFINNATSLVLSDK